MVVIVLTACPEGLRGHLTRWLLEISAGVFVGNTSTRVRTHLWERVVAHSGGGRAIMVYSHPNEQRLSFNVHGHHWQPVDYDGLRLMLRPPTDSPKAPGPTGWSRAGRRKRFGQRATGPTKNDASET